MKGCAARKEEEMEGDSGGDVNIMDEHQLKAFIHRMNDKPTLTKSNVKLHTLQL